MNKNLKTIILKCPNCSANLDITPQMESFACGYCGTQQMVQRSGGTVSLKLIGDAIARVQVGTDRTASELAVRRLRGDWAAVDFVIQREREDSNAKNGGGGYIFCMICCVGAFFLFMQGHEEKFGLISLAAAVIPIVFYRRLKSAARIRFTERMQPLTLNRDRIDSELQRHLALLNNQSHLPGH